MFPAAVLVSKLLLVAELFFFSVTWQKTLYLDSSANSNGDGLSVSSPKKFLDEALSTNESDLELVFISANEPYRITQSFINLKNLKLTKNSLKKPRILLEPSASLTLSGSLAIKEIIFSTLENAVTKKLSKNLFNLMQVDRLSILTLQVKGH